jgi:hypothetical protein
MWQNLLIALIVLVCIILVGRRFYRQFKGRSGCGCCSGGGCSSSRPGYPVNSSGKSSCECDK